MTVWLFIGGLICLVAGAELLALSFGISPLVVNIQLIRQELPI